MIPLKDAALEIEQQRSEMRYPSITAGSDIQDIITKVSALSTMATLDPVAINEYCVRLAAYSWYVTQECNKLQAKVNICESNIKSIVGKKIRDVDGWFNEKDLFIRQNDEECQKLENLKALTGVKLDTFKYISQKIDVLMQALTNLARAKSYQVKHDNY